MNTTTTHPTTSDKHQQQRAEEKTKIFLSHKSTKLNQTHSNIYHQPLTQLKNNSNHILIWVELHTTHTRTFNPIYSSGKHRIQKQYAIQTVCQQSFDTKLFINNITVCSAIPINLHTSISTDTIILNSSNIQPTASSRCETATHSCLQWRFIINSNSNSNSTHQTKQINVNVNVNVNVN